MSDDGAWSVVVIALLGNPFSPTYAAARRGGGPCRALDHAALNVAVYGPSGSLWSLTERRLLDRDVSGDRLSFGTSSLRWEGGRLVIDVHERTAPLARPIRGTVVFHPYASPSPDDFALDAGGQHVWWPAFPSGRVEVALDEPRLRFVGDGYQDANSGDVPLEATFSSWSWSRATLGDQTVVTYDVHGRTGSLAPLAVSFGKGGGAPRPVGGLVSTPLPSSRWRLTREARSDRGATAHVMRALEDTPFYARALLRATIGGRSVVAMHESLSLDRLRQRWVQLLLGFRMKKV